MHLSLMHQMKCTSINPAAQTQRFVSPAGKVSNFMASNKNLQVSPAQKHKRTSLIDCCVKDWDIADDRLRSPSTTDGKESSFLNIFECSEFIYMVEYGEIQLCGELFFPLFDWLKRLEWILVIPPITKIELFIYKDTGHRYKKFLINKMLK